MFTLTSAAAQQVRQAASASGAQEMALRIAAKIDADGSVQYGMGFDDPKDEDMKLDLDGVAVVIAEDFQPVLENIVLDYVELEPGQFNFIFMDARQMEPAPVPSGGCGGGTCGSGGCGGGAKGPTH
ncbi:hypothetical protein [Rhodoferax sp.]|uniref:hypothetical protein n=1 Tax=Rhodoferax sp. TaxID=50421 RepID=UPI0027655703|nr:iron-sulfur cluster biosynthesis family protein [Rhodoferax sp.]